MTHNLSVSQVSAIPSMSSRGILAAVMMEEALAQRPQVSIDTGHVIHAGVYARTIMIPKDVALTGALVRRSVNLIISGHVIVYIGNDEAREYKGYAVITAMPNRKQVFIAKQDTYLTMFFATEAESVEAAEDEFTDEVGNLMSRKSGAINDIVITGA